MDLTDIQRYRIALERLRRILDIKLGKPLLIRTFMGHLRVLHASDIGYFRYISAKKSWEIALTDGSFLRLRVTSELKTCVHTMKIHPDSSVVHHQPALPVHDTKKHCIMCTPFHHVTELQVSQKHKKRYWNVSASSKP